MWMLSVRGRESNMPAVMAVLKMNARNGLVHASTRSFDCRSKRGHGENPTARGHNSAVRALRSRVKNVNVIKLFHLVETGNRLPGFIFVGVTAGSEHDCDRRALVPLIVQLSILPSIVASRSGSRSDFIRGKITCVSGSPKRQLNSRTRAPSALIMRPG